MTAGDPGPGSEQDEILYLQDLYKRERDGERTTLVIGPYTAYIMVSGLQLAMRHPGLTPAMRGTLGEVAGQALSWFTGTPGEVMLRAGFDPGNDVPAAGGGS